jgi:2',3'-cyclic-nucleotide 2'-phosphodiesterase (5'-nucleotidase family)
MPPSSVSPGNLRLIKGVPNPRGVAEAQLFLFLGDPTVAPIEQVLPDPDITLPGPPPQRQQPFRLKILHFNDLHGHVSRFTPYGDQPVFSRMVWRIRQVREERARDPNAAVLVLSAGDDLVGAVFDELLGSGPDSCIVHTGYRLYSAAGIDAGVLGNHDLDLGARLLAHTIRREAHFPLLAANLTGSHWLSCCYYPAALLVVKGIRVGLIGLLTPAEIKAQVDDELHVTDPVQAMAHLLPALRPLCDVVVVLSHLGYSLETNPATVRGAGDVELARSLPAGGVHLIIGGHTHHVLNEQGLSANNIIKDIPIVQAGTLGQYLGEVDITIRRQAVVTNVRLTPTPYLPVDQRFEQEQVQPLVTLARSVFNRSLGQVADHADLSTDAVRNSFGSGESALANFVTDAMVHRCRANNYEVDLAFLDASDLRRGLAVGGELTFGDWFNVMPFADSIRLYRLTGYQLKALLADNARRADWPDEPRTERGFLHFSQELRYTIELEQDRRQVRASLITVDGMPLDEQLDRYFLIAASSFVRQAAIAWERCTNQHDSPPLFNLHTWSHLDTPLFLRNELITYIRENGGVTEQGGARRDGRLQIVWLAAKTSEDK